MKKNQENKSLAKYSKIKLFNNYMDVSKLKETLDLILNNLTKFDKKLGKNVDLVDTIDKDINDSYISKILGIVKLIQNQVNNIISKNYSKTIDGIIDKTYTFDFNELIDKVIKSNLDLNELDNIIHILENKINEVLLLYEKVDIILQQTFIKSNIIFTEQKEEQIEYDYDMVPILSINYNLSNWEQLTNSLLSDYERSINIQTGGNEKALINEAEKYKLISWKITIIQNLMYDLNRFWNSYCQMNLRYQYYIIYLISILARTKIIKKQKVYKYINKNTIRKYINIIETNKHNEYLNKYQFITLVSQYNFLKFLDRNIMDKCIDIDKCIGNVYTSFIIFNCFKDILDSL